MDSDSESELDQFYDEYLCRFFVRRSRAALLTSDLCPTHQRISKAEFRRVMSRFESELRSLQGQAKVEGESSYDQG